MSATAPYLREEEPAPRSPLRGTRPEEPAPRSPLRGTRSEEPAPRHPRRAASAAATREDGRVPRRRATSPSPRAGAGRLSRRASGTLWRRGSRRLRSARPSARDARRPSATRPFATIRAARRRRRRASNFSGARRRISTAAARCRRLFSTWRGRSTPATRRASAAASRRSWFTIKCCARDARAQAPAARTTPCSPRRQGLEGWRRRSVPPARRREKAA